MLGVQPSIDEQPARKLIVYVPGSVSVFVIEIVAELELYGICVVMIVSLAICILDSELFCTHIRARSHFASQSGPLEQVRGCAASFLHCACCVDAHAERRKIKHITIVRCFTILYTLEGPYQIFSVFMYLLSGDRLNCFDGLSRSIFDCLYQL
jgi:hypothetical protein